MDYSLARIVSAADPFSCLIIFNIDSLNHFLLLWLFVPVSHGYSLICAFATGIGANPSTVE